MFYALVQGAKAKPVKLHASAMRHGASPQLNAQAWSCVCAACGKEVLSSEDEVHWRHADGSTDCDLSAVKWPDTGRESIGLDSLISSYGSGGGSSRKECSPIVPDKDWLALERLHKHIREHPEEYQATPPDKFNAWASKVQARARKQVRE
jgi:hypothetical protein